jgi:hypothetical protein
MDDSSVQRGQAVVIHAVPVNGSRLGAIVRSKFPDQIVDMNLDRVN